MHLPNQHLHSIPQSFEEIATHRIHSSHLISHCSLASQSIPPSYPSQDPSRTCVGLQYCRRYSSHGTLSPAGINYGTFHPHHHRTKKNRKRAQAPRNSALQGPAVCLTYICICHKCLYSTEPGSQPNHHGPVNPLNPEKDDLP